MKIILLLLINLALIALIYYLIKKASKSKYELEDESLKRIQYIEESIFEISKATLQYQVELSEAVIRIKKLLDLIEIPQAIRYRMDPIQKMYLEISKFSILEERKQLSTKEAYDQDQERYKIEDNYKDQIFSCISELNLYFKHRLYPNETLKN